MRQKKVIRLTESDLHNIITESVKQYLCELHALTYANAANKAKANGDYKRMAKFRRAAVDAWNKEYADPLNKHEESLPKRGLRTRYSMEDNDGYGINMSTHNFKTGNTADKDYVFDNNGNEYEWDEMGNCIKGDGDFGRHDSIKYDGMNVARQMSRGDGKYVSGKSWQ